MFGEISPETADVTKINHFCPHVESLNVDTVTWAMFEANQRVEPPQHPTSFTYFGNDIIAANALPHALNTTAP
jgi:hypothetical protein